MKRAMLVFLITVVLLACAGAALAAELSGEVVAVDAAKGSLTVKAGTSSASFDAGTSALFNNIKIGDKVIVQYKEESGNKIAVKVSPRKKKALVGC